MDQHHEYELKAPLGPAQSAALAAIVDGPGQTSTTTDTYLDTADGALYRAGVFLRRRGESRLELKWTPDPDDASHSHSVERSFELPLRPAAVAALHRLLAAHLGPAGPVETAGTEATGTEAAGTDAAGTEAAGTDASGTDATGLPRAWGLSALAVVRKRRTTHLVDGLTVCVDEVDGLGRFIEIEASTAAQRDAMRHLARRIGVDNLAVGYVELLLRRQRPLLYRQGRYQL